MIKNISVVRNGLVIEVGSFKKSHVRGCVAIYSKAGERIGGFSVLDTKLKIIHKFTQDDILYITYAIIDREEEI